jgi:transposase-like protein
MRHKKTSRQYRAPSEQRMKMVEQFHRSGLTRAAFSRQYGVPKATLNWWLKKAKQSARVPVPIAFHEVQLTESAALAESAWSMEIVAPSGLTIRCRKALAVGDLVRLTKGGQC